MIVFSLKELNDIDWHLENFNGLINEIMCKSIRTERKNQKINLLDKDYQ